MLYPKNLTNNKFGRLKIIKQVGFSKFNVPMWECICDCGNKTIVSRNKLITKRTQSCGCLRKELTVKRSTTHGLSNTRINRIFRGIKRRCNNPHNRSYINYGGRGIKLEWKSFEEFYKDMNYSYEEHYKLFGEKNTSIDRINVNGNYCKSNCQWATIFQQANNKRNKVKYGFCKCLQCNKTFKHKCF